MGVPGSAAGSGPLPSPDGQVSLHVGMQVLLSSANEMAFIRYLGTADFAPGLWLGLELRSAKGKNDGSVGGRRYFACRPGHGVLVRPSRVTYRGINGSRLVNEMSWELCDLFVLGCGLFKANDLSLNFLFFFVLHIISSFI